MGQLFNRRKTDIDDLLMNVLGAVLGFSIWLVFNRLLKGKIKSKDMDAIRDKPFVYILLAVLGTFFLYNWRWFIPFVL